MLVSLRLPQRYDHYNDEIGFGIRDRLLRSVLRLDFENECGKLCRKCCTWRVPDRARKRTEFSTELGAISSSGPAALPGRIPN